MYGLELTRPLHPNTKLAEPLQQYGFSHCLGDQQRERECCRELIERHDHEHLVVVADSKTPRADTLCKQALCNAIGLEHLEVRE
jgi:hypothetical protein